VKWGEEEGEIIFMGKKEPHGNPLNKHDSKFKLVVGAGMSRGKGEEIGKREKTLRFEGRKGRKELGRILKGYFREGEGKFPARLCGWQRIQINGKGGTGVI